MPGAALRAAAAARGSVSKRATTLRSLPIDATAGRRSISKAERTPPGQGAARLRVLLSGAAAADEARAALTRACDEAQLRVLLRSAKGREVRATLADLAESSRKERQAADARAELRRGGRPPPRGQGRRVAEAVRRFVRDCWLLGLDFELMTRAVHYLRGFILGTETADLEFSFERFRATAAACVTLAVKAAHVGQERCSGGGSLVSHVLSRIRRHRPKVSRRLSAAVHGGELARAEGIAGVIAPVDSDTLRLRLDTMPPPAPSELYSAEVAVLRAVGWAAYPVLATDVLRPLCELFAAGQPRVGAWLYSAALPHATVSAHIPGVCRRPDTLAIFALTACWTQQRVPFDRQLALLLLETCGFTAAELAAAESAAVKLAARQCAQ